MVGYGSGVSKTVGLDEDRTVFVEIKQKVTEDKSFLGILQGKLKNEITLADLAFKSLNKTIAEGVVSGIKNVSRGIAEAIVLGKKLTDTFRELAQKVLVNIIEKLIEEQLIRLSLFALEKFRKALEQDKTREMQKQINLLQSQLILENGIAGARMAQAQYGSGTGGGSVEGQIISAIVGSFFAEGGAINAGQPAVVGERGRELFIPNTSGTIIPNQDLGVGGSNYNFTIVATDVRGVKELLLNNRSTIVNIMNQALNAKGKSSLV